MFLAPDGGEIEIANSAADFLANAMPIARLHTQGSADLSKALRARLGESGWFALAIPEGAGGSGLSAVEHVLFFREIGRQCGPVDVLAQALAAMLPTTATLHAAILSGETAIALAVADSGKKRVLGAPEAGYALQVGPNSAKLFTVGGKSVLRPGLDPATSMRICDDTADVASSSGTRLWQMGALGAAAMLVGIAEAALDMIVDYARIRETFGRKIGSYQAVRHPCADMALRAEAARCQLWFAAAALKEGRADADMHIDACKHLANQAALANTDTNIQLHGGIGVTEEHNAHLLLKHAMVLAKLFGGKRFLLERLLHAAEAA